jgi:hypothetical protein
MANPESKTTPGMYVGFLWKYTQCWPDFIVRLPWRIAVTLQSRSPPI